MLHCETQAVCYKIDMILIRILFHFKQICIYLLVYEMYIRKSQMRFFLSPDGRCRPTPGPVPLGRTNKVSTVLPLVPAKEATPLLVLRPMWVLIELGTAVGWLPYLVSRPTCTVFEFVHILHLTPYACHGGEETCCVGRHLQRATTNWIIINFRHHL
jgi:hypothetical protein